MQVVTQTEHVLIAEDHELYANAVKLLLQELMPQVSISLSPDFPSALSQLVDNPDITLLILDIKLPGTKDLDGLKEIRTRFPTLTIIVISTLDFDIRVKQMIELGANGFIAKSTPINEMKIGIKEVLDGNIVVKSEKEGVEFVDLSPRQLETLRYLAEGLSNKEIARKLKVSPLTAKEYVSQIIARLNAKNRTQAILIAQRYGLLMEHF